MTAPDTSRRAAIQSMTGFGRAIKRSSVGSVTVELRSTNHRYLEVEQRLPNGMSALQGALSELLRQHIHRGRIDVSVFAQSDQRDRRQIAFDEPLLERYHAALLAPKARFGLKGAVSLDHLLALPQAITVIETPRPTEPLSQLIRTTAETAMRDLIRSRQREGRKMPPDKLHLIRMVERHLRQITARHPKAMQHQRRRARDGSSASCG